MKRKFKMPSDFTISKSDQMYQIKINGRNPIWVTLSIILIITGIITGFLLSFFSFILVFIGGGILLNELSKKHIILLNNKMFNYNETEYHFESLKKVSVTTETTDVQLHVSGSYNKTLIKAINFDGQEHTFGNTLIEEYQKCLVFIIHQFWVNNEDFIDTHFK